MTKLTYNAAPTRLVLTDLDAYPENISPRKGYDPTQPPEYTEVILQKETLQEPIPDSKFFVCVATSLLGLFLVSLIFNTFGIGRINTVVLGVISLLGLYTWGAVRAKEEDRTERVILLRIYAGIGASLLITTIMYLTMTPNHFALALAWMIFLPIAVMILTVFVSVIDTPLGQITPSDGAWGYIALRVGVGIILFLLIWSLDGGEAIRIIMRDIFYMLNWNWLAHLLHHS